ncbi:MAG: MBL fold metallo-hydrolase [Hyphomicrobiales bacterium]|nr:MBL fold metallo-hydrolase [Hyphomicrobiales bacterium]
MSGPSIKIGDYTVTAYSDGRFQTTIDTTTGVDKQMTQVISGKSLTDPVYLSVNAFLIEGKDIRALVDAGTGDTMGPSLGKLPENLTAAGVAPDTITHVLLTHIHPDHSNGLIDSGGQPWFPKAQVIVQDEEYRFWVERDLDEAHHERQRGNMQRARSAFAPYARQTTRIGDGEFLPGIVAQKSPGHTPGHTAWTVEGNGDSVMIWGDTIHMAFLQLQNPGIAFIFDVDPEQAVTSRKRLLDQAATDRTRIAGMHLDFPGFGYVKRRGSGYAIEDT